MGRTVYLNGAYVPEDEAKISVFDRAFLFGDGIYEVTAVLDGRLIDLDNHLARLDRSLRELAIVPPLSDADLRALHRELVSRNGLTEGIVYLQISRGVADRDFAYPEAAAPTIVGFTQAKALIASPYAETGVSVITIPDIRWKRRDIKSTALLAQAMGKQEAKLRGAYEAWMIEDGVITEGTSSSSFIMDAHGVLRTQPLGSHILPGVTRRAVLSLAKAEGLTVEERPFTLAEALGAREAFLTAASAFVLPVIEIDGQKIGDGKPGRIGKAFRAAYIAEAVRS